MKIGCVFGSEWEVDGLKLVYPVDPRAVVTQTFAEHIATAKRNGWKSYNGGIDWGISAGTPICAAAGGTSRAEDHGRSGYGLHIRVEHGDGYVTIYAHLASVFVAQGQRVRAGEIIGLSGNTGNSTGPHLHFELRQGGKAIDPKPFLVESIGEEKPALDGGQGAGVQTRFRVMSDTLNVRSGPGTQHPVVGRLQRGDVIQGMRLHGAQIWVEVEPGKYAALLYGGQVYLGQVLD